MGACKGRPAALRRWGSSVFEPTSFVGPQDAVPKRKAPGTPPSQEPPTAIRHIRRANAAAAHRGGRGNGRCFLRDALIATKSRG